MAENWCKEHQQAWFKKGKMKNFAHPIKDEEGEDTGEWCNRPDDYKEEKPVTKYKADPEKSRSIERQTSLIQAVNLCASGKIEVKDIRVWADKFSDWFIKTGE